MTNILLLFLSLNSFASLDCAKVDLNQISDDKISEYTHCFKVAEVTISKTITTDSKLKFTPVCERSKPVKQKLEEIFDNSCEQITKHMLFAYNGTFIMSGGIYRKPIVGDFSGMSNLKQLSLVNSYVEMLPTGLFDDLENLQKLSLFNNRIEDLPINIFDKLLKLKELNLSFNNIRSLLHPIISNTDISLDTLELSDNPLTHIYNSAFKNMSHLRYLSLSYTNLSVIGKNVFKPLDSLKDLYLDHINTDDTLFSKIPKEQTISINDISLSQLTLRKNHTLELVSIGYSKSLIRNQKFIDQLKEKGVSVVD